MASTTYEHFVGANKMYAVQEQFRHVTKMVCARFRDLTKTYHLGNVTVMVRNAGQLPQLSGSVLPVAAARVVLPAALQGLDRKRMTAAIKNAPLGRVDRKIALLRYVERLPLPDIAAQTHYSRTAIGYRLKSIDEMLNA